MMTDAKTDKRTLATQLEQNRWKAMLDGDFDTTADLLSDAVRYIHSSGMQDDKASYLQKFRAGVFVYHSAASQIEQVTELGADAFIATGTVLIEATVAGTRKRMHSVFSVVWRCESGDWLLVALQTTLLPSTER